MLTNCFGSRNFLQPEKAQRRLDFFFGLGGVGGSVPNVFPKRFPMALHFLFHIF